MQMNGGGMGGGAGGMPGGHGDFGSFFAGGGAPRGGR